MATSTRVGRPGKMVRRVELRLNALDPFVIELEHNANTRHISLAKHITDILSALSFGAVTSSTEENIAVEDGARALADQWM